ncbi:lipase/acyltransferase domain-containing protein [Burkholderia glumae]
MASNDRIIPARIADDGSAHYTSATSAPDDSTAVCYMVPNRIIPVIVVPGVMGSNLSNRDNKSVWLVDSAASLLGWIGKGPADRKNLLDPKQTIVSDEGAIPTGTALSETELRDRGWGTVSKMFYGDFLVWLENALNDCRPETDYGKKGLRAQLMQEPVAPSLERLSEAEVNLSYKYRLPVHAVGYNWLQSNAESAKWLGMQIDKIITEYKKQGRCEKVILVTHSMGGLVSRFCTEVLPGYRHKILGVVHGVMPATGSATAYRRVKAGTEPGGNVISYVASLILGNMSSKVMPVFTQAPGPLQLLPSPEYGQGWLQIRDGDRFFALPQKGNPYDEIYTKRNAWWSLIDEKLIDPGMKSAPEQSLANFKSLIAKDVREFHQAISGKYHPQTYAFWGDDKEHKTWGDVVWKRTQASSLWNSDAYDVRNKPVNTDTLMGTIDVVAGNLGPIDIHKTFELQAASENGDGTVPVRSGAAPTHHARAAVAYTGVDHGVAYTKLPQQKFALWGIVKILQNVAGTMLEYPT